MLMMSMKSFVSPTMLLIFTQVTDFRLNIRFEQSLATIVSGYLDYASYLFTVNSRYNCLVLIKNVCFTSHPGCSTHLLCQIGF